MGWIYDHEPSPVDRRAACRRRVEADCEIVADAMRGSTYYAAVRHRGEDGVSAVVLLTDVDNSSPFNFGVKWMGEECGPFQYDCPASVLDRLTPTDNGTALEWRRMCRETKERRRALSSAPYGSRFVVTLEDGRDLTVVKMAPAYQFRSWWLLVDGGRSYVRKDKVVEARPA